MSKVLALSSAYVDSHVSGTPEPAAVRRRRGGRLRCAFLVGVVWLGAWCAFALVRGDGEADYLLRDDALITLSHARGLVDVGTVSVGANGARVEGYSAPLQFALAVGWFAVGGSGVDGFFAIQIAVSTILLGSACFVLATVAAPDRSRARRMFVSSLVAFPAFASYRFFGWHSSGMENAITNALLAVTLALLALGLRRERWLWLAGVSAGLLSVSRVEFGFHVAPLLVVATILLARRVGFRPSQLVPLLAPAAGIWVTVQAARFWYFGALVPNSGIAQRIEPARNMSALVVVLAPLAVVAAVIAISRRDHVRACDHSRPRWWTLAVCTGVVGSALLFGAARGAHEGRLEGVTLADLGLVPWALVAGALFVAMRPRLLNADWLVLTAIGTGAVHLVVFGPARLSNERVVSFLMVPLVALVVMLLVRFDPDAALDRLRAEPMASLAVVLLLTMAVVAVVARPRAYQQDDLCCTAEATTARIERVADRVRVDQGLDVVRVANPDLGALSLRKDVDVTDLGFLGDPLLTRLWMASTRWQVSPEVVMYLNEVAQPDVVELHGGWACQYAPWVRSPRFEELYQRVAGTPWSEQQLGACDHPEALATALWVRRDLLPDTTSKEIELSHALQRGDARTAVAAALDECSEEKGPWRCTWVGRAIGRDLRVLDERGMLDELIAQLGRSPTAGYDQAVLRARSDGNWHADAVRALQPLLDRHA